MAFNKLVVSGMDGEVAGVALDASAKYTVKNNEKRKAIGIFNGICKITEASCSSHRSTVSIDH